MPESLKKTNCYLTSDTLKHTLLLGFGIVLALPQLKGNTNPLYAILLADIMLVILLMMLRFLYGKKITFIKKTDVFYGQKHNWLISILTHIWIFIIISWFWGVFIGILNGINTAFVFRNFFGLLVYAIFPIMLIVSPSSKDVIFTIFIVGIIQITYGFFLTLQLLLNPITLKTVESFSELRTQYSVSFIVIFPLFVSNLARLLITNKKMIINNKKIVKVLSHSSMFLMATVYGLVVPAMSKGYILATSMFFAGVLFICFNSFIKTGKTKIQFLLLLCGLVFIVSLIPSSFIKTIVFSYSSKEYSNNIRSTQADYLISEFSLIGNGLGAPLQNGYSRDVNGYGFELTYLNIIHKLGAFSIFIFISYIITIWLSFVRIIKGIFLFESFFVLGLMGYLIVGAGNPLLLHPIAVVLHCCAMYILVRPTTLKKRI